MALIVAPGGVGHTGRCLGQPLPQRSFACWTAAPAHFQHLMGVKGQSLVEVGAGFGDRLLL